MLFCLTLVRTLTGASVHHDVRRDGVERHDRQMTPAHGASDEQGREMEPSLIDIYRIGETRMKEKKDPTTLEAFFSLWFFSFSSSITRAFPSPIKGEAGRPMKGEIETQEHDTSTWLSGKRALSTRSLLPPETWDPLSRLFVTPTANQVSVTRAAMNWT